MFLATAARLVLELFSGAPALELEWDAPAECPDGAAVAAEVERLAVGERRPVSAVGVVTRISGDAWHLDLEVDTADGRQHFAWDAVACASLARGAALAIGAAGDVASRTPQLPPPTVPDPVVVPDTVTAPPVVDAPASEPAPPIVAPPRTSSAADASRVSDVRGWLRLHVAAGVAQLPGFDGRLGAAGGLAWRWLRAEVVAAASLPQRDRSADVGARMWSTDLGARVGAATSRKLSIGGLIGIEAGLLRAKGFDVETIHTANDLWLAATFGPTLALAIGRRAALFAGIDGVVALRRPRFAIRERADTTDGQIVFQPRAGGARAWLGFGMTFGGDWTKR